MIATKRRAIARTAVRNICDMNWKWLEKYGIKGAGVVGKPNCRGMVKVEISMYLPNESKRTKKK